MMHAPLPGKPRGLFTEPGTEASGRSLLPTMCAPTPPPYLFAVWPSSHEPVLDRQAIHRLARVNGRPPFPMQQGLPLQHYTMVYSMQPNRQQPRERTGHGEATTEQT